MRNATALASFSLVFSAAAQPPLEYANLPTSTIYFTAYVVTDPGSAEVPTGGADQIWDLSTVQFAEVGTSMVGPAVGTPFASTYPEANYAAASFPSGGGADYSYLLANPTALEIVAEGVPAAPNVYTDYRRYLQFSTSYGGSFTDTYASPAEQGSATWTYAGYGTLITSLGTFTDQVLMLDTDGDLFFWNPDPLFPRLIANSDDPVLMVQDLSGVDELGRNRLSVHVYPVPSDTRITVQGVKGHAQWSVRDMLGRELLQGNWTDGGPRSIDIAGLAQGQYLLHVNGPDGVATTRFERL